MDRFMIGDRLINAQELARLMSLAFVRKSQGVKETTLRGTAASWNGLPNRPSEKTLKRQRLTMLAQGVR